MFLFLIIIDMVNYDVDMNIVTPDDIASKVCRLKGDYLDFCIAIAELQALLDEWWGKIKRDLVHIGLLKEEDDVSIIDEAMIRGLSKKQKEELAKWHEEFEWSKGWAEQYEREIVQSYTYMRKLEQELETYNDTVGKIIQRINYFSKLM